MGNVIFRDKLNSQIEYFLREAKNCSRIDHPGMKGILRQIFIEQLLNPLLPEGVHIGTGKIADSKGALSAETDIILFEKRTVPPILYDTKMGIFPIESVYYAIEVKSKLTNEEFEKSINNGIKLRELKGQQPNSALFAFDSDLSVKKDSERFIQRQKDMRAPVPINIFCVVDREYGYWKNQWNILPKEASDVVVGFVVGILNTLVQANHFRRPSINPGEYFYPEVG